MSHFTRMQTQMVEETYITQALSDLGYEWEVGDLTIGGFGAARRKVDIRVKTGLMSSDIGFIKSERGYEIVADWWGVRNIKADAFRQKVTHKYAYHAARDKLQAQGFNLVSEEVQENGEVRLLLRRVSG